METKAIVLGSGGMKAAPRSTSAKSPMEEMSPFGRAACEEVIIKGDMHGSTSWHGMSMQKPNLAELMP